ncbi:MAG: hypothetical protein HZC01_03845 [Candidatus Kerfeldbacteria bacterium]|nr:hypothetical protein [Candidatus Kerfeldbacteria bacterium]
MSQNIIFATLKYIAIEILWDILYFPIWWYSKGLVRAITRATESATFHLQRRVALGIWLRSMFKPMYGDATKEGRIISIVFRIIILGWKIIIAGLWIILLFLGVALWVALPIIIGYYIFFQVTDITFFRFDL